MRKERVYATSPSVFVFTVFKWSILLERFQKSIEFSVVWLEFIMLEESCVFLHGLKKAVIMSYQKVTACKGMVYP